MTNTNETLLVAQGINHGSQPQFHQHGLEIQSYGSVCGAITHTALNGDAGSTDPLAGDVLRTHELQVWFLAEHLVDTPLVHA